MKRRRRTTCLVAALLFLASIPMIAQTTGRLRGDVSDPDGQPIPGATITISSASLPGGSRVAFSGEAGAYRFTAVPPGTYNILVEMDGFQTVSSEAVRVNINSTESTKFVMYAEFAEAVTVTGETPLVDVTSSEARAVASAMPLCIFQLPAMKVLRIRQYLDAGKFGTGEKFQGGATSCGDVGDAFGNTRFLD